MTAPVAVSWSAARLARIAGATYLVLIGAGVFAEFVVRGSLRVAGDALATAERIRAAEGFFRLGLAGDVVMLLCDLALAVLFYALLEAVSRPLALLAAFFRLVQAAVLAANLLGLVAVLRWVQPEATALFGPDQAAARVVAALDAHAVGYDLGLIFFGAALLVLAALLIRARFVPRPLGWLLGAGGVVYLGGSVATLLVPAARGPLAGAYLLPFVAELGLALWFLVRGVGPARTPA